MVDVQGFPYLSPAADVGRRDGEEVYCPETRRRHLAAVVFDEGPPHIIVLRLSLICTID
jgi:hypothetical protein